MQGKCKTILVTGATGKQGGATARHLLAQGWNVRAMTRNPAQPQARHLVAMGAELCRADLTDSDSVSRALAGVYGVFSVQSFAEHGPDGEVLQGKLLADLALEEGVEHFVYTSVSAADRQTGLAHFETKARIEEHIRAIGLPATVIRPVAFMESFTYPFFLITLCSGLLLGTQDLETRWQLIACEDVGQIAAAIFDARVEFLGQQIEIAGDEIGLPEAAEVFARVLGKPVRYKRLSLDELSPEIAQMFKGFVQSGQFRADVPALRTRWPNLLSLEQWLRVMGWERLTNPECEIGVML